MSIVADVTGPLPNGGEDKTRSLDIPRALGSVLRETAEVERRASLTMGTGARCGQDAIEIGVAECESSPVSESCSGSFSNAEEASSGRRWRLEGFSLDFRHMRLGERFLMESVRERERVPSPGPMFTFPPPPVDSPPANGTVVRRKSVRVSLQPTFSPSPPALYDDDGNALGEDVWADLTSEEEVYRRARGLLSSLAKIRISRMARGKVIGDGLVALLLLF